jgi:hypothetical protein
MIGLKEISVLKFVPNKIFLALSFFVYFISIFSLTLFFLGSLIKLTEGNMGLSINIDGTRCTSCSCLRKIVI